MKYASTFLSHSSADKDLVAAVAEALGRRGVVPWLDKDELIPAASLIESLDEAIRSQSTVSLFLSEQAIRSPWVENEVTTALNVAGEEKKSELIVPIFLDDPIKLVQSHELLRSRWMHPDGDRVKEKGILAEPNEDFSTMVRKIAEGIALHIYKTLNIASAREVVVYLDQRGTGRRIGRPADIPENLEKTDYPALVFRPDRGNRSRKEVLDIEKWRGFLEDMGWTFSEALKGVRWRDKKKIRLAGSSQLALPFAVGRYFDRLTDAELYCVNSQGRVFTNHGQQRHAPLDGGDANCDTPRPGIPAMTGKSAAVSLVLSLDQYVSDVERYLATQENAPPLVWVKSDKFDSSEQVMSFVSNVVALLKRLVRDHGIRTVHFYFGGLPFTVMPLVAANLVNVINDVVFMEFRKDLLDRPREDNDLYIALTTDMG